LEFVVEHRLGIKIGHANALSKHVGAVTLANIVDRESFRCENDKDDFCIERNPGTISKKCEFFGTIWVAYISANLVASNLDADSHQRKPRSVLCGLSSHKENIELIRLNYCWPGMRRLIEEYIRRCDSCQWRKIKPTGKYTKITTGYAIEALSCTLSRQEIRLICTTLP